MHPTLTFDLVLLDHRDRLEASRRADSAEQTDQTRPRTAERRNGRRPVTTERGHPPERQRHRRPRATHDPAVAVR